MVVRPMAVLPCSRAVFRSKWSSMRLARVEQAGHRSIDRVQTSDVGPFAGYIGSTPTRDSRHRSGRRALSDDVVTMKWEAAYGHREAAVFASASSANPHTFHLSAARPGHRQLDARAFRQSRARDCIEFQRRAHMPIVLQLPRFVLGECTTLGALQQFKHTVMVAWRKVEVENCFCTGACPSSRFRQDDPAPDGNLTGFSDRAHEYRISGTKTAAAQRLFRRGIQGRQLYRHFSKRRGEPKLHARH